MLERTTLSRGVRRQTQKAVNGRNRVGSLATRTAIGHLVKVEPASQFSFVKMASNVLVRHLILARSDKVRLLVRSVESIHRLCQLFGPLLPSTIFLHLWMGAFDLCGRESHLAPGVDVAEWC